MLFATQNFRSPLALLRFYGVTALGLALDLLTKSAAERDLAGDRIVPFIPGYLQFEFVKNPGAVFGIGAGQRPAFIFVSVVAIVFLTMLFANSGRQKSYQVLLGMLLAGVLGNLYDRILFGHVRDMIHVFPRWPHLYPWIFNIADSLLCVGVTLMLVYSFIHDERRREKPSHPAVDDAASH